MSILVQGDSGLSINPIISQVMQILDEHNSGSILKKEFETAIVKVAT